MSQPKLNLWRITGLNVFNVPDTFKHMFPDTSANEQDCVPIHEQEAYRNPDRPLQPGCTKSADANVVSLF